jgi:hypothetical protein
MDWTMEICEMYLRLAKRHYLHPRNRDRKGAARQSKYLRNTITVKRGTVGGPIVRDRTFFFFGYSGLRQRQSNFANTAEPPTELERQGDFSKSRQTKPKDPGRETRCLTFSSGFPLP